MADIIRRLRGASARGEPRPVVLSSEQVAAVLNERSEAELGISGEEFVRRLADGKLPDSPVVDELAILVGGVAGAA
jgi:hypothetical protein